MFQASRKFARAILRGPHELRLKTNRPGGARTAEVLLLLICWHLENSKSNRYELEAVHQQLKFLQQGRM